ncbi:hypothetical protein [Nitrosotalea sinensis]|nr:hypothetical protein [Candidatus Nitrosotalea sinensis]
MFSKPKNRKAISAVLTTLIILVASVVLGTGVVLYGTSLFQTGAQSAGVATQGVHVWVDSSSSPGSTYVYGAAEVRNSGDKILSVDQINVRGNQVPFASWYYDNNSTRVTTTNFQSQLQYPGTNSTGYLKNLSTGGSGTCSGTGVITINEFAPNSGSNMCLSKATGPISLKPGDRAIVYFQVPSGILSTVDAGSQSSVAVYAGNVGAPQSVTVESK